MDTDKKNATAQAAKKIVADSSTQVTELIESDRDLQLSDRIAASAAALILCGPCYFFLWLLLSFQFSAADGTGLLSLVFFTWRFPLLATLLTTLAAFVAPNWTTSIFGALMKRAEMLIDWQSHALRSKPIKVGPDKKGKGIKS